MTNLGWALLGGNLGTFRTESTQILAESSERGFSPGKTQLVKLLYLSEVEFFRLPTERLTDLRWLFHHYGPYAVELDALLSEPEFERTDIQTQSQKDFIRFSVSEQSRAYVRKMEPKVSLLIKRIVGHWKDKTLEELLDYVYFETEPMQAVTKRGDVLDFSTIRPDSETAHVIPLKASREAEEKVAKLRERMKTFFTSMGEHGIPDQPRSEDYHNALESWNSEEDPQLRIPPNLIVTIKPPSDTSA